MKTKLFTLILITTFIGCSDATTDKSSSCPGMSVDADNGDTFCVFQKPVTETGFNCPSDFSQKVRDGEFIVCGETLATPEQVDAVLDVVIPTTVFDFTFSGTVERETDDVGELAVVWLNGARVLGDLPTYANGAGTASDTAFSVAIGTVPTPDTFAGDSYLFAQAAGFELDLNEDQPQIDAVTDHHYVLYKRNENQDGEVDGIGKFDCGFTCVFVPASGAEDMEEVDCDQMRLYVGPNPTPRIGFGTVIAEQ